MTVFEEYEKKLQEYQKYREARAVYDSKVLEYTHTYEENLNVLVNALGQIDDMNIKNMMLPILEKYKTINESNSTEVNEALQKLSSELERYIGGLMNGTN